MAADFDRQLKRHLEEAGCRFVRSGKGSHQIWWSPITQRNFVVPAGIKSRHTANGVLKDAGLPKRFA
jgi:predicted RNA binding protein YcfA (HicA-like mRNA interferase family)